MLGHRLQALPWLGEAESQGSLASGVTGQQPVSVGGGIQVSSVQKVGRGYPTTRGEKVDEPKKPGPGCMEGGPLPWLSSRQGRVMVETSRSDVDTWS